MASKYPAFLLTGRERVSPCVQTAIAGMRPALVAVIAAIVTMTLGTTAHAATITVNSLADTGASRICVLRDAITAANTKTVTNGCAAGTGNDTIHFSVTGTILLTSTLPEVIDNQLTINGPASPGITIDGGNKVRVLEVPLFATLNLNNLTIVNGLGVIAPLSGVTSGGAIFNQGTLTVASSTFSGNSSALGGAILNLGTLTITKSTFSGNSADTGGGIYNKEYGTLTVIKSTFAGNSAIYSGGGIYGYGTLTVKSSIFSGNSSPLGGAILNNATLTVTNSTFSGNSAEGEDGGGILNSSTLIVINSTFSGNSSHSGGGIFNFGTVTVTNSTFAGNSALASSRTGGADIDNVSGIASLKNTILADGSSGGNCAGTIVDVGYNISNDYSCGFTKTGSANNGDGVDPLLSPAGLADNGGPTQTIALQAASDAIDAIPVADCTDQASPPNRIITDQRGFPRPDAGEQVCDIGAYESAY